MSDLRDAVTSLLQAYNRHDLEGIAECFGPRGIVVAPDGIGEGREEIASYYAQFLDAFPDTTVTPHSVIESDGVLVAEYTITGTHRGPYLVPGGGTVDATGRPIALRACCLSQAQDGLLASHRIFYDQCELAAQLGAFLRFGDG